MFQSIKGAKLDKATEMSPFLMPDSWKPLISLRKRVAKINNNRPHSGINYMTPTDFLLTYEKLHNPLRQAEFPTFQMEHNNYIFFIKFEVFLRWGIVELKHQN